MGDREPDRSGGPRGGGYRWECPICGVSRLNLLNEDGKQALRALGQHVRGTSGQGHGDQGAFPDDLTLDDLEEHVERADGE